MIQHNKPTVGRKEEKAIEQVIKSGWFAQGSAVEQFEDKLCKFVDFPEGHGVALSSGTSSLFVALKVLGIGRGDEVVVPSYTCSAVLNAIYMAGAIPALVDIEEGDFNISSDGIKKKANPRTKAVIVTHTFGVPADVRRIHKLGIPIIEDCATALGSRIGLKHVGSIGDCAIFSFYASKVITTGQGGMFVSRNKSLVSKARDYRNFDYVRRYYPRFNFQMTDIQAAMGIVQLSRLDSFLKIRRRISAFYKDICHKKGWDFQKPLDSSLHQNWFRFMVKADKKSVLSLKDYLEKKGICSIIPIQRWELLHNYLKLNAKNFPNAEKLSRATLSLPVYPGLIESRESEKIVKALNNF